MEDNIEGFQDMTTVDLEREFHKPNEPRVRLGCGMNHQHKLCSDDTYHFMHFGGGGGGRRRGKGCFTGLRNRAVVNTYRKIWTLWVLNYDERTYCMPATEERYREINKCPEGEFQFFFHI